MTEQLDFLISLAALMKKQEALGTKYLVRQLDAVASSESIVSCKSPELIFSKNKEHSCQSDVWTFGCIVAQIATGVPIFSSFNKNEQFAKICMVVGFPKMCEVVPHCLTRERYESFLDTATYRATLGGPKTPLSEIMPDVNFAGLHLIESCLKWNPSERIAANDIMAHPALNGVGIFWKIQSSPISAITPNRSILRELNLSSSPQNFIDATPFVSDDFELEFVESIYGSRLCVRCCASSGEFLGDYLDGSGAIKGSFFVSRVAESDICRVVFAGEWKDKDELAGRFRVSVDLETLSMPEAPPDFSGCIARGSGASWYEGDTEKFEWIWERRDRGEAEGKEIGNPFESVSSSPRASSPEQDVKLTVCISKLILRPAYASRLFGTVKGA